ncbi:MAG: hypothetical protein CL608_29145 [Anaerolineaceae bacterium]|nr:hypothetical protein [Anaerolineaceae bacterium]
MVEEAAESKRFHYPILQASKTIVGQIAANVVAGFKIFVNVAEQQGHLRHLFTENKEEQK